MSYCWEENPTDRPTFAQLASKMEELLQEAEQAINIEKMEDDNDYIEVLPPDDQELFTRYDTEETLD